MAIIKSFAPFQNLSNFQVFENDALPNSQYFRITELKETLTGGKNGFLIEGSEHLKESTEVKIEILDVEGNPIYFEPGDGIPEYYEGVSKLISVHVYDDTPIGIGKITILGELKTFINEDGVVEDIPNDWKGLYNVKWQKDIQVNKTLANETVVRFFKRPSVVISELVKPIVTKTIVTTTASGSVNGFPLAPPSGQKLDDWRAGTNYLLQRTSGSWDIDVDENVINISSLNYSPTIIEVLSDTDIIVDRPFTGSNGNVSNFSDEAFTVSFQDIENETVGETSITGSFAKIDISQLKTFVGDVSRVKIFRKSRNAVGDFQFVQEAKLESQELLRDVSSTADTETFYGKLTDNIISTYWISSSDDHPITLDSSKLSRAAKIDYNNLSGSTQQFITQRTIPISENVEYTLQFKTLLSGSIDDSNKSVRAFLSSSDFTQDFITASGSAIYRAKQDISQNIISENTGDANLVFEVSGDDWFISNISLRNAQDTSFSPDEFTIIQDIPRKTATETFDFRFEFYDVNNNFIPVEVKATKEFDGGNDFPTSGKLFTFESDRNAFRFSSGSIGNPPFQQLQFKTSQQNLTGSVTYASAAFDADGTFINPSSYTGQYPGALTSVTPAGAIITIANFSGSDSSFNVGSIVYTASLGTLEEFETVFRLEDGDNAPQLVVSSNANQFIYEPTKISPKPSSQNITVRAQRKNLASLVTPITVNSGSNRPGLTYVSTVNGIDTFSISATTFSQSFAANAFDEVTYQFTGSDVFGNEQTDEITLSKVINFDAVSISLTNEATSFPAKSTGEVTGGFGLGNGEVFMNVGSTRIEHSNGLSTKNSFDITHVSGSDVTAISSNPSNNSYGITAFPNAKDSGSLTLDISYKAGDNSTTQSFQKVVSYAKSKKAVPTVLTKVSPSTQTINSSSAGFDTPQTMQVIVQEGGDEYTFDTQSLSSGGDALARRFNIEGVSVDSGSAAGLGGGLIGFGSLTSSFNSIIGSASLNYVDSEGTYFTDKLVRFDLSVSKIGVDGVNGASGSNAKAVSLSSTRYAIVYDGDGNLFPTNQNFTLSGSAQNFNTPEFQFLSASAVLHDFATTSEVVVSSSGYPSTGTSIVYEVRVREQGGSYEGVFDNIDVFAVQSGSDAFTTFLTNEAHVFPADSTGTVTSVLSDGAFETRFFRGATRYTYDGSSPYDTNSYRLANVTATGISVNESTVSNDRKITPTAVTADSGSVTLDLVDNNTAQSFEKTYTFSISKKGAPVTNLSLTPQTQTVKSGSVEGIGTPSNITIKVNEGGSDYGYDSSGGIANSHFRITGVTNGTNNNDGTITPSTPTNSDGVSGGITASFTNSEGTGFTDKLLDFSVGVAGIGDQGVDGQQGATGLRSATGVVYYQLSSASSPGTPSATAYNFSAQTFTSLTSNWGLSAPTFTAGNSNKYWFSRFNVNESSGGSNTGSPSFTSPVQAIGFTGLVTFTSANNITDGTNSSAIVEAADVQSHIGGANTTNIDGGVVSTGILKSQNHSTGSGNGFTAAGTEFNLNTGQLASQKFFIDGTNATFSGSIDANDGNIGGLFLNDSQLIGGSGNIGKAGGQPFFTLDSGIAANFEYDGNDTVTGLFLAGITGSSGVNFNHNTYDNPFFTGSDFTGSAIAIADVGDEENVYIRLGNRNAYIKLTSTGSDGNGALIVSSSNFNITPGGDVQATNFQMTSGSVSITGPNSNANIGADGTLTAVNANIAGAITANSGEIGGFVITSSSLASTGTTFARLQGGTTPSLIFFENAETESVKLTAEENLTNIDIGVSPPTLLGSSYTSISTNSSQGGTSFSGTFITVNQPSAVNTEIPTGNVRFPNTGTIPSDYDGLTATFTGTLTPQGTPYGYFIKMQAEAFSSNIAYASISGTIGIRVKKISSGTQVAEFETGVSVSQAAYGAVFNLEDNFSSKSFNFNFDMETGEAYKFEVFIKNGSATAAATGNGLSMNLADWRTPNLGSISVSMRGGSSTPPFSELTRGGLQVVGNAAAGADKRAVKIPAASGVDTLQVTGSISATGDITAFNTSDERLKENIVTIANPIEKIKQVKGVEFTWKPGFEKIHMYGTGSDIGVIAQDVQKVLPQIVSENIFNKYLGVQYDKLTPLLVESIKELSKKIEELENKLKDKQ